MAEHDMKKITKEFLKFGDVEIEKKKFHNSKELVNLMDVSIKKILVPNDFAYGENKEVDTKYFIRYKTGKILDNYTFNFHK